MVSLSPPRLAFLALGDFPRARLSLTLLPLRGNEGLLVVSSLNLQ